MKLLAKNEQCQVSGGIFPLIPLIGGTALAGVSSTTLVALMSSLCASVIGVVTWVGVKQKQHQTTDL